MFPINPENYRSKNILSKEEVIRMIKHFKDQNKKVGLCGGCFDLLHAGHITYLESAKDLCDVLFVGVTHDDYNQNKNPNLPIFPDKVRAYMISRLKPVDFVFIDDCLFENMEKFRPHIYIKGKDYSDMQNPGILCHKKF